MKRLWSSLLIVALAAPVAARQAAVPGTDAATPGGPAQDEAARGGAMREGPEGRPDVAAMRRREGDDIALVLGLSPAQRPALDAFLATQGPPPRPEGPPPGMPSPGATQPNADRGAPAMQGGPTARGGGDQARAEAGRRFQAQLDPRQKQVFEALMRLRRGPGGPGGPGRRGPGGPGPGRPDGAERVPG